MEKKDFIVQRLMQDTDKNFVYVTWLRGAYFGNEEYSKMEEPKFMRNYQIIVDRLLAQPKTFVKLACLKEDPDICLAYVAYREPDVLHWCYTKPQWRRIGLIKDLMPKTIKTYTHSTTLGWKIAPKNWELNFFL